jgi:hypothetical protein
MTAYEYVRACMSVRVNHLQPISPHLAHVLLARDAVVYNRYGIVLSNDAPRRRLHVQWRIPRLVNVCAMQTKSEMELKLVNVRA